MVDLVCGFFLAVGYGPIWPWFVGFFPFFLAVVGGDLVRLLLIFFFGPTVDVDVEVFLLLFSLLVFVVAVDLAGGWWRRWWVDVVVVVCVGGCGGRRC